MARDDFALKTKDTLAHRVGIALLKPELPAANERAKD